MPTGPTVLGKPMEIKFVWEDGCKDLQGCCGSIGAFLKVLMQPHQPLGRKVCGCSHADWKPALQQLLVLQFWTAALVAPGLLVFLLWVLLGGGFSMLLLMMVIQGVLQSFFLSWFMWHALSNRETSCCCCLLAVLEHPIVGALWGILMVANGVYLIIRVLPWLQLGIYGTIMFIGYCVYAVVCVFVGIAAIRVGMAASGVEMPSKGGQAVGAAEPADDKPVGDRASKETATTAAENV